MHDEFKLQEIVNKTKIWKSGEILELENGNYIISSRANTCAASTTNKLEAWMHKYWEKELLINILFF